MKKYIIFTIIVLITIEANSARIKKNFDESTKITTIKMPMNHQVFFQNSKYGGNSHNGDYFRKIKNNKTIEFYYIIKLGVSPLITGFKEKMQVTVDGINHPATIVKQTKSQHHKVEISPNFKTSISQRYIEFTIKIKFNPTIETKFFGAEKIEYRIYIKDSEHYLKFKINKIQLKRMKKFIKTK